jgi:GMP synthase-like glutamine amidotransferase
MRVLTIVHEQDAGPGVFNDVLAASAADVDTWLAATEPEAPATASAYDAIMSFGGSQHPDQEASHPWLATEKRYLATALRERVPVLGVCLGAELLAEADGGGTQRMTTAEIGWHQVQLTADGERDPVIGAAGERFPALEWHSYELVLPEDATALARGSNCVQAYRIGDHAWGIQFHAEVTGEDFQYWLDTYATDADAVAAGIDPEAIARETEQLIGRWNELGRGLCERFLQVAAGR